MGIPSLKRLKLDAVPTIFPRSVDYLEASNASTLSMSQTEAAKQQQQSANTNHTMKFMPRVFLFINR